MLAIDILKWPGFNMRSSPCALAAHPRAVALAKRRPVGTPLTWGEAMVAAVFVFSIDVHGLRRGAEPVADCTSTTSWAGGATRWSTGPGGILQPQCRWGPFPFDDQLPTDQRRHRRADLHRLPRAADLSVLVVAEAGQGKPTHRARHLDLRSAPREEALSDGPHRRQPPDARLERRVRACRGRRRLPGQGGQAEAVHPHRPVRMHHVRGLRRHLPVEVHPHGHAGRDRRGDRTPSSPARIPRDHVRVHHRRRRLHPVRAVRRPLPDGRHHHGQGRPTGGRRATPTPARTTTATPTACGSEQEEDQWPRPSRTNEALDEGADGAS